MLKRSVSLLFFILLAAVLLCGCDDAAKPVNTTDGKLPASLDDPGMEPYLDEIWAYLPVSSDFLTEAEEMRNGDGSLYALRLVRPDVSDPDDVYVLELKRNTLVFTETNDSFDTLEVTFSFHSTGHIGFITKSEWGEKSFTIQCGDDGKVLIKESFYKGKPAYVSEYVYDSEGRLSEIRTVETSSHSMKYGKYKDGYDMPDVETLNLQYDDNQYSYTYEYDGDTMSEYIQGIYAYKTKSLSKTIRTWEKDGLTVIDESVSKPEMRWERTITDVSGTILASYHAEGEYAGTDTVTVSLTVSEYGSAYTVTQYVDFGVSLADADSALHARFDKNADGLAVSRVCEMQPTVKDFSFFSLRREYWYAKHYGELIRYTQYEYDFEKHTMTGYTVRDGFEESACRESVYDPDGTLIEQHQADPLL